MKLQLRNLFNQKVVLFGSHLFLCLLIQPAAVSANQIVNLHQCEDPKFNISFQCSPDWEIIEQEETKVILVLNQPKVTLTLAKVPVPLPTVSDLTTDHLATIGNYQSDFTVKELVFAGQPARQVIGLHNDFQTTLLVDFYLIRNGFLESYSFSVRPNTAWAEVQELVIKIAESIQYQED